ncbi:hypothetical protein D7I40_05140 [Citrobacter sp. MH181794]|nr:hypothetical protein D7I40_05140 [Citrobacter sp. MH181794]
MLPCCRPDKAKPPSGAMPGGAVLTGPTSGGFPGRQNPDSRRRYATVYPVSLISRHRQNVPGR